MNRRSFFGRLAATFGAAVAFLFGGRKAKSSTRFKIGTIDLRSPGVLKTECPAFVCDHNPPQDGDRVFINGWCIGNFHWEVNGAGGWLIVAHEANSDLRMWRGGFSEEMRAAGGLSKDDISAAFSRTARALESPRSDT